MSDKSDKGHDADTSLITKPDPELQADIPDGYGMIGPARKPGIRPHEGGDPRGDGNAQYGAAPVRDARYQDDHDVRSGKRQHRGVQPGKAGLSQTVITESGTSESPAPSSTPPEPPSDSPDRRRQ